MVEIVFVVEEDPDGGYTARALMESMFTQADDIPALREMVRDAVRCHFPDASARPKLIRLRFVSIGWPRFSLIEPGTMIPPSSRR